MGVTRTREEREEGRPKGWDCTPEGTGRDVELSESFEAGEAVG